MGKDLAYYMGLPYHFTVHREENSDGRYWAARVAEVPTISGSGDTPEAALASVRDSLEIWIEDALGDGVAIPEPQADSAFSGQFRLRVPATVHRELTHRAEREGVSLNTWCATVLAQHGT